jgi:hypothetical protein
MCIEQVGKPVNQLGAFIAVRFAPHGRKGLARRRYGVGHLTGGTLRNRSPRLARIGIDRRKILLIGRGDVFVVYE